MKNIAMQNATKGASFKALASRNDLGFCAAVLFPLFQSTSPIPTMKVKSAMKPRIRVAQPKPTSGRSLCKAIG